MSIETRLLVLILRILLRVAVAVPIEFRQEAEMLIRKAEEQ